LLFGDVFRWFLHFIPWMYAIFLLPVVWLTDLQSIPHASTPTLIISTNVEVDMTIHCRVVAFLSADTLPDLVTLIIDLLTFNSWRTWRVMWPTLPTSLKTLSPSVLKFWVVTYPVGYHWKCVRGHCACAESRDPWVGGQKQLHPRRRFAYSLYNFYWAVLFFSRPRSEGWPHNGRTFSIYPCPLSFW